MWISVWERDGLPTSVRAPLHLDESYNLLEGKKSNGIGFGFQNLKHRLGLTLKTTLGLKDWCFISFLSFLFSIL